MINYNWKKINNKLNWNNADVVNYFKYINNISIPECLQVKFKKLTFNAVLGNSFLIHPRDVLTSNYTTMAIYQYIELASLRNPFDYHIRGVKHIPLAFVEEYQLATIEYNPLLTVENDKVYFKYEQE